jgi:N-glycosidase YbiA
MTTVERFTGDHDFLSNFQPSPIEVDGILFPTVEHAFQAAKTFDPVEKQAVAAATTPGTAKRLGRKVQLRPDWKQVKVGIMEDLVRLKFTTHADLREQLLATGDAELVEGNNWNDRFWGVCRGNGQNQLGLILMKVRSALAQG